MLDTSALIGLIELENTAIRRMIVSDGGRPTINAVVLGELHAGVAQAPTPSVASRRQATLRAAMALIAEPIDRSVAEYWGRISAVLRRTVSQNDRWILASAIALGRSLITQDEDLGRVDQTPFPWERIDILYVPRSPSA